MEFSQYNSARIEHNSLGSFRIQNLIREDGGGWGNWPVQIAQIGFMEHNSLNPFSLPNATLGAQTKMDHMKRYFEQYNFGNINLFNQEMNSNKKLTYLFLSTVRNAP